MGTNAVDIINEIPKKIKSSLVHLDDGGEIGVVFTLTKKTNNHNKQLNTMSNSAKEGKILLDENNPFENKVISLR